MRSRTLARPLPLALALALLPAMAAAQGTVLDQGTFRLTVHGQEVGNESFTIRRNGAGPTTVVLAQGHVALDTAGATQELNASLELHGAEMRPTAYQVTIQGTGAERIAGRVVGGRFSARILSPSGEAMREFLASDDAVLVDDGLVSQYYFLARRAASGATRIPMIIPREDRQVTATVTAAGAEPLEVGDRRVDARRFVVAAPGLPERQIWVDAEGRLLRVAVPSRDFVATRTSLSG